MSTYRDSFGRVKRTAVNRDFRRKHLHGAARLVEAGKRTEESFGTRMKAALGAALGAAIQRRADDGGSPK